jgi:hypothetical protein
VAAELARLLLAGGAEVNWIPVVHERDATPVPPKGIQSFGGSLLAPAPLHRIERGTLDLPLESGLTRDLRSRPTDAVVHLGVGARGSPNLLWIADRMGVPPFAIVRAEEIVCQRGNLVDAGGSACVRFEEPGHCGRCCSASWLRRALASEVQNRLELVVASLQVARGVIVRSESDATMLEQVGVPRRSLWVVPPGHEVRELSERLLGARGDHS